MTALHIVITLIVAFTVHIAATPVDLSGIVTVPQHQQYVIAIPSASTLTWDVVQQHFSKFASLHGKTYATAAEQALRLTYFNQTLHKIVTHNSRASRSYNQSVNQFSDLSAAEFAALKGVLPSVSSSTSTLTPSASLASIQLAVNAPATIDWRTYPGVLTPVKNQGSCGSCWAFATTGAVESAVAIARGSPVVSLSEQNIIDCDQSDGGCGGGVLSTAMHWYMNNGGDCTEADYPYLMTQNACRACANKVSPINGVTELLDSYLTNNINMRAAILQQPIIVAIDGDQNIFQSYHSGIISYDDGDPLGDCGDTLDHAVLAVGFGVSGSTPYWIIKNQWGLSWGEEGYARIKSGIDMCGIEQYAIYPSVSLTTPTQMFAPVYAQGSPGLGIGGYDLQSTADQSFAFDYDSSGKLDHLVLYRPGSGTIFIMKKIGTGSNPTAAFNAVYAASGIGGYDLKSSADRAFAFDYDSSGKLDHIVLYRPGTGTMWILKRSGTSFTPVYAQGSPGAGIGGYDLQSAADVAFAFDYDSSGKLDHLALYRPGTGTFWILRKVSSGSSPSAFAAVYAQGSPGLGIGGFDLKSANDRAFAFDYDSSGKSDHIVLYRPGTGTLWILQRSGTTFTPVYAQGSPGLGIGGYDLTSTVDQAFAFDFDRSGKADHIVLYRPGTGTFWIVKKSPVVASMFVPVYAQGSPGLGIGGFDLHSSVDRAFAFDYEGSGYQNYLVLTRAGTGTLWILKKQ